MSKYPNSVTDLALDLIVKYAHLEQCLEEHGEDAVETKIAWDQIRDRIVQTIPNAL